MKKKKEDYRMDNMKCTTSAEEGLSGKLVGLKKRVDSLTERLTQLFDRLNPVLAPSYPTPCNPSTQSGNIQSPKSPTMDAVEVIDTDLRLAISRVEDLIERSRT
jgi:hypothetical protein